MIAAGRLRMVIGAIVTTEDAAIGLHGIAGADDANAVGAGALHHLDIDGHDLVLM